MIEQHLRVGRTARYFVLGDPATSPSEIWYLLHGYGHTADGFLASFEGAGRPGRLLVAPEGLSRFYSKGTTGQVGASWMTRVDREAEITDYVAYLDALHTALVGSGEPPRIGILGFSQGAATASRWAVLGAARPSHLVLWGGEPPADLEEDRARAALEGVRVELVVGARDPYLSPERVEQAAARLRSLAPSATGRTFAGGHEVDPDLAARILDGGESGFRGEQL